MGPLPPWFYRVCELNTSLHCPFSRLPFFILSHLPFLSSFSLIRSFLFFLPPHPSPFSSWCSFSPLPLTIFLVFSFSPSFLFSVFFLPVLSSILFLFPAVFLSFFLPSNVFLLLPFPSLPSPSLPFSSFSPLSLLTFSPFSPSPFLTSLGLVI